MTSRNSSHAEKTDTMSSKQSAPKLHVQRSVSKETITIHFSAVGKEEEEEEDDYGESTIVEQDQSTVTALEAKEDLSFEHDGSHVSGSFNTSLVSFEPSSAFLSSTSTLKSESPAILQISPQVFDLVPSSQSHLVAASSSSIVSLPSDQKSLASSALSSPSKAVVLSSSVSPSTISSAKPFISLVKSLSTDVEPKDSASPVRHRHLMKTLVKSLSTDTSKQESESMSCKTSDSKLNLHLFKQFTQPRVTGGDSKTAPSSPLTSPSDRSFFKVTEVEAKIEDTRRRLSEVIYEPFQLLSKIMGDDSSHRPKALSSSASELSNLSSLNGHMESNNNYSIKEEECDSEGECSMPEMVTANREDLSSINEHVKEVDTKNLLSASTKESNVKATSSVLEKCSLSALASKEVEEYCELYNEDFFDLEEELESDKLSESASKIEVQAKETALVRLEEDDEADVYVQLPQVPLKTLLFFILLVYAYFILPLPSYVSGLLFGTALGFMVAIGIIWVIAPNCSHGHLQSQRKKLHEHSSASRLDIKEPEIWKGWMNEISNYDPETYHATLTHSVFVRVEGATLRLSKPNKSISRRASFNEPKPDVTFVSQKIYDLTDSKVHLVPKGLARKRIWNKKYPICIELAKQDDFMSKAQIEKESSEEKPLSEKADQVGEEQKKPVCQDGLKSSNQKDLVLYLFGRTGREKEEWFQRFLIASKPRSESKKTTSISGSKPGYLPSHSRNNSQSGILTHSRNSSKGSLDDVLSQSKPKDLVASVRQKVLLEYCVYMAKLIPLETKSPLLSPIHSAESSPTATKKLPDDHLLAGEEQVAWANALLGRIFWDFLGENYWSNVVSKKIQMKLSKIRLPYFMNELTLTELDMGISVPKILEASKPSVNYQGLWFDLEVSYDGSFQMTLETKMNLTKLGKESFGEGLKIGEFGKEGARPRAYCLADSDEESSSAGSSDEDDAPEAMGGDKPVVPGNEGYVGGHRASKIMRFVDKITKSKYFQKATETEFIKKKIEEVSNTPLLLTVEVQECKGKLAVNIPPPPTDRIWYGFRNPPHLELKARPKLGEREVTLAHVTDWIEKKLKQEFQKIFVMPNMDDVYISIMHSAMDPRSTSVYSEPVADAADRL